MRIMLKKLLALSLAAGLAVPAAAQTIRSYITCPDRSELFAQQKHAAEFSTQRQENRNYIIIDPGRATSESTASATPSRAAVPNT